MICKIEKISFYAKIDKKCLHQLMQLLLCIADKPNLPLPLPKHLNSQLYNFVFFFFFFNNSIIKVRGFESKDLYLKQQNLLVEL